MFKYTKEGESIIDLLLIIWGVIDIEILLLLIVFHKNSVSKHTNEPWKRSIESVKGLDQRFLDILGQIFIIVLLAGVIYFFLYPVSVTEIQKIMKWYQGIFIVALFPILFEWIKDNNFKQKSFWNRCPPVMVVIFSIIAYIINAQSKDKITQYIIGLKILITIFATVFLMSLYKILKDYGKYRRKKTLQKGIRRDLLYRTSGLAINVSNTELSKNCERYFDEYIRCYKRIKGLCRIEYVSLEGIYREFWYLRTAHHMKIFVIISMVIVGICIAFGILYESFFVIMLIALFVILIYIFKKIDKDSLFKIGIRFFYDEWGYYMYFSNSTKFVGDVQLLELSKYHKYVHSFLDIAALCRAVVSHDLNEGRNNICIVSRNLNDLFNNYIDDNLEKNWVTILPLWIVALFEFYVTKSISTKVKKTLLNSINEGNRVELYIFLQSFWTDMERRKLENDSLDFMIQFVSEFQV